jgi:competence protein ComGC
MVSRHALPLDSRGFTIVELVIALGIALVIAVVSLPALTRTQREQAFQQDIARLRECIQQGSVTRPGLEYNTTVVSLQNLTSDSGMQCVVRRGTRDNDFSPIVLIDPLVQTAFPHLCLDTVIIDGDAGHSLTIPELILPVPDRSNDRLMQVLIKNQQYYPALPNQDGAVVELRVFEQPDSQVAGCGQSQGAQTATAFLTMRRHINNITVRFEL